MASMHSPAPPPLSGPPAPVLPPPRILIIGAGITGLLVAQALKVHNIPFTIYERDPSPSHSGVGWALTLHWALPVFLSVLPDSLLPHLPSTYVNPEASAAGEDGNFLLLDLRTGDEKWRVPPNRRIRVRREGLRKVLMEEVDVEWGKKLEDVTATESGLLARFADGTVASGAMLVGCDGARSRVRQLMCPRTYQNHELPVRLLGVSVIYPAKKVKAMRALDPFFLQAADYKADVFFWFSFLDTPTSNTRNTDTYACQILTSYPFRPGFLGNLEPTEVPTSSVDRLKLMKSFAAEWAEPMKGVVLGIPEGTEVKAIRLEDWVPDRADWDNKGGRLTLIGDAAHAMTMYRGEAANHGITDVSVFLTHLLPALTPSPGMEIQSKFKIAIEAYEAEMHRRAPTAVLLSRRACLDAHDGRKIDANSPLVAKRAVRLDE
ncbi:hypothetical protein GP486_001228 [Trichoglossum hirsutum]|uniref:FAD-binding domain-containing protein n=1 Tax=Trichoglossum hirsutum TaxID=265104 RepID=A0A9P8LH90_9PEZI|nr:hypothetical protein GP486_001228 [Trichoglossum hirsutum]